VHEENMNPLEADVLTPCLSLRSTLSVPELQDSLITAGLSHPVFSLSITELGSLLEHPVVLSLYLFLILVLFSQVPVRRLVPIV